MTTTRDQTQPSNWCDRVWTCQRCGHRTRLLVCLVCDRDFVIRPRQRTGNQRGGDAA